MIVCLSKIIVFMWTGDLSQLKVLVKDELNLTGQWSSPGGDVNTIKHGYTIKLSTIISLSLDIILPLETVSPNHTGGCVYMSGPQFLVNDYLNWKNLKWRCYGLILGLQDCLVVLLVLSWVSYITHLVLTTKSCYVT